MGRAVPWIGRSGLFLEVVDALGVAVYAVSGALAAGRKRLDVLGVIVVAVATAVGGGTLRDVLLARPVFWVTNPEPLVVTLLAAGATLVVVRWRQPPSRALAVADAFGLAFFAVGGARVAQAAGADGIVVVVLGAITGAAGGVLRDVLLAEVPIVLRRGDLYVTAAVAGIATMLLLETVGLPRDAGAIAGMTVTLVLRIASMRWGLRLPTVRVPDEDAPDASPDASDPGRRR